jgi:hypothetical protein
MGISKTSKYERRTPDAFFTTKLILPDAIALFVHRTMIVLRQRQPLLSSLAIQFQRFCVILPDAIALFVYVTKTVLRQRQPLLSSLAIPLHCFSIIARLSSLVAFNSITLRISPHRPSRAD